MHPQRTVLSFATALLLLSQACSVMAAGAPPGDPLAALLRDPVEQARYLAAVNSSCAGAADEPGSDPQPLDHWTSGGYNVKIDFHTMTVTDPAGKNTVQHWGDPHENLNGKHIKDWGGGPHWEGLHRTIVLGDGTKITMEAPGPQGVTTWTAIYDGNRHLQFDNCRSRVAWQGSEARETAQLERTQYDGETSTFTTDAQTGVGKYDNVYNEDERFRRVETPQPLGTTGGLANPRQVNDLFDDPRLRHT